MKKLLLSALLAASATSLAAIVTPINGPAGSNTTIGYLPITVKGNVIDATNLVMELVAEDNAGPDGRTMTFNFGDLVRGSDAESLIGTFRVRLLRTKTKDTPSSSSNPIQEWKFDNAPQYELEGGNGVSGKETLSRDTTTPTNVKLNYTLNSLTGAAGVTVNRGKITVTPDVKHDLSDGATGVKTGNFTDNAVRLKVTVTNQTEGMS